MDGDKHELAVSHLTDEEARAYAAWQGGTAAPIGATLSAQLYGLWLQGRSCQDLAAQNPGLRLGDVVAARVQHRWDERRERYLDDLFGGVADRVRQAQVETVSMLCDMLAAFNKQQREVLQRYIQTGDPKLLEAEGVKITNITTLRAVVDALQKMTGTEPAKKLAVVGVVEHRASQKGEQVDASALLRGLLGEKK